MLFQKGAHAFWKRDACFSERANGMKFVLLHERLFYLWGSEIMRYVGRVVLMAAKVAGNKNISFLVSLIFFG